jgi:hypothetical protein
MQQKIIDLEINTNGLGDHQLIGDGNILIKDLGYVVYGGGRYGFDIVNTPFYINLVNKLMTPSEDDIKGKSFYRHSDVNLPREKFNMIKETYDCKLVKTASTADYEIVSLKTFSNMVEWTRHCRSANVGEFLKGIIKTKQYFEDTAFHNMVHTLSMFDKKDLVDFTFRGHWNSSHASKPALRSFEHSFDWKSVGYISHSSNIAIQAMLGSSKLVADTHVYKFADKQLHTLDEEGYENIKKMIYASDEDRSLAISIMSNTNIETSFDKLALLLYFNTEKLKSSKNYNSVAFKVLRTKFSNYMGGSYFSNSHSYNALIYNLSRDKALTEFAFKESARLFFENVICTTLGTNEKERAFSISLDAIKLNPKYQDRLVKSLVPF